MLIFQLGDEEGAQGGRSSETYYHHIYMEKLLIRECNLDLCY
jgi:hypothetical protein